MLMIEPIYLVAAGSIVVVLILIAVVVRNQSTDCPSDFLLQSRSSLDGEPWWERSAVARRMSIDVNTCRVCQKPTTTQCSQCKSVKYCGPVCQRKDWGSCHKFECQNLKNLRQNAAKAAAAGNSKPPFLDPNEDAPVPQQVLFSYELFLQLRKNNSSCRRAPVGLINHGNNCYANAALQCLLYTKPLRAYLDQGLHSKDCNRPHDREWCLLCVLSRLCHEMANASLNAEMSLKPLLRHLRRFAKTMSYGRQEDAHEFFYSVLNTMEAIQLANLGGKDRFDMRSQETTLVHHVFGGYLRSQVVCCGCGAASRRYEAALDLQLEVPAGVDRLEDVLHRHTADEVLDGDNCYACDGCKRRCRATRSTRFEVAPNTLVLCLKRFGTGRFGKINKVLVYGEKLDLGPFMARGAMDDLPATYTLTGVVVHLDQMNSTSFGHYVSFVRTWDGSSSNGSSGQWYACDDSRVCRTRASDVLSQNAYMLFYQRDMPKTAPQPGYVRPMPLLPLTAAQQAAAAAAAAPVTPRLQEVVKVPNGVSAAVAAAAVAVLDAEPAVPDTLQLDQQQQQQQQQQQEAAEAVEQQQQLPLLAAMRSQPPPPVQVDTEELLPRIATAPAALALLAGRVGSSSRDDDDSGSHATTSPCLADVSECSTPSYQGNGVAAAADGWGTGSHMRSSSNGGSSSGQVGRQSLDQQPAGDAGSEGAVKVPQHTLLRRRQRQKQQQQEVQGVSAKQQPGSTARKSGAEASAGSSGSSDSSSLPSIQHRLAVAGPELLQVYVSLPGVRTAADVQVSLEPPGEQHDQQCLWLQVPGRFAELQLPLSQHLPPGTIVGSVSGKFYRRKQQLKLKLQLAAEAGVEAGSSSGAGQNSAMRRSLDFHLSDSFEASSGSESEGYQQPAKRAGGMHVVASERDLSSIFGRHSATVAHELMQQLQRQQLQQVSSSEQDSVEAAAGTVAAGAAAGKKGGAKKKGKKKGKKK